MGEKIGRPLTEETARPRVFPKTLPAPKPEEVPATTPEKESEPIKVGLRLIAKAESLYREGNLMGAAYFFHLSARYFDPYIKSNPKSVTHRAYEALETGVQRAAKFLGISEQQAIDMVVTLADRILAVLEYPRAVKGSTTRKAI